MEPTTDFFEFEQQGTVLIVTPQADMGELEFENVTIGMKKALDLVVGSSIHDLILDFHKTTYFGSTALGFFVRLWKTVSARRGRMIFACLSEHEKEILSVTKLDTLWQLCATREEALQALRK